jgi:hypothetical protein
VEALEFRHRGARSHLAFITDNPAITDNAAIDTGTAFMNGESVRNAANGGAGSSLRIVGSGETTTGAER